MGDAYPAPAVGQWGYRVYPDSNPTDQSAQPNGPYLYWSYKTTDGTFYEQGDPEAAGHLFAWRTADTVGFDDTYWGVWPPNYGPAPDDHPGP